jgi:hypothetical protein
MVKWTHPSAGSVKYGGCALNPVDIRKKLFHHRERRECRDACSPFLHHLECPPFLRLNSLRKEVPHSRDLSAAGGTRACLPVFKVVQYGLPDSVFVELERDT